jgi:hypothetical protein
MNRYALVRAVLWLAIEDYAGLWEVRAEVAAHQCLSAAEATDEAKSLLGDLYQQGCVKIYLTVEPGGEPMLVADSDTARLLDLHSSWEPPMAGSVSVRISATSAGEERYLALPTGENGHERAS